MPNESFSLLLVEDNPADVLLLKKALGKGNVLFKITHKGDLSSTLEYLSTEKTDIILLDLGLPDNYGLDAIRKVMEIDHTACIVVHSGDDDQTLNDSAIQIGAQDYITKGSLEGPLLIKTLKQAFQRNQLLHDLKDREQQLNEIYETAGVAIFKIKVSDNKAFTLNMANSEFIRLLNKESYQIIGKPCHEIIAPAQTELVKANFSAAIKSKSRVTFEVSGLSNLLQYGIISVAPHYEANGTCDHLIGSIQNLTDIKKTQIRLEENKNFLNSLFEESLMPKLLIDQKGKIINVNKAATELFGGSLFDLQKKNIKDFYIGRSKKEIDGQFTEHWKKGSDSGEVKIRNLKGSEKTLLYNAKVLPSNICLTGYVDISEKKFFEDEIRRLSLVAKRTNNGVFITNPQEKIIWVNDSFLRITGYSEKEVIGKNPGRLLQGKETSEEDIQYLRSKINAKKPFARTILNYRKNGEKYWNRLEGHPIYDEKNNLEGYFAIQTDLTKEVRQNTLITSIKNKMEFALQSAGIGIFDWNQTLDTTDVYGSYFKVLGHSSRTYTPVKSLKDYSHPDDWIIFQNVWKSILEGSIKTYKIDYRIRTQYGDYKWIRDHAEIVEEDGDRHIIGLIQDVTSQYEQERTLLRATIQTQEKERSRLSLDIHDGLQQVLLSSLLSFRHIRKTISSGNTLDTENVKFFDDSMKLLNYALEETRNIARNLMPKNVKDEGVVSMIQSLINGLKLDFEVYFHDNLESKQLPELLSISLYRITQEALSNIVKHAKAKQVFITLNSYNHLIDLTIEDDGVGFENNTTTNNSNGILSMSNRAKSLGGELELNTAPNKGTFIRVSIPLTQ